MADTIKVRATKEGLFGRIRNPDDEFVLSSEEQFSEKWMERVDGKNKKPKTDAEQEDAKAEEDELDVLRARADALGIKYKANWGRGALEKHIALNEDQLIE